MLAVKQLFCERDQRTLFQDLSFGASAGDIVQVRGRNGAGKSTLLKILCGIYDDFEGEVNWELEDYPLYLGHRAGVNDVLTVKENLIWLARLHQQNLEAADIEAMLSGVGLSGYANVPCGNLSEGQRKRVGLARLFGFSNRVWILDEPFSAIDQSGIETLEALITRHAEAGGLILLTSHQTLQHASARVLDLDQSNA